MVNLDATTPQLNVVKVWADAHVSRNLNGAERILSKDFVMQMFPKAAEFPELTKEEYLQKYAVAFALFAEVEVVFHEVIEAPGKTVAHLTLSFTTVEGNTIEYDSVTILSFVDEDGELKVLEAKDFSDPEKRGAFHVEAAKLLYQGIPVA